VRPKDSLFNPLASPRGTSCETPRTFSANRNPFGSRSAPRTPLGGGFAGVGWESLCSAVQNRWAGGPRDPGIRAPLAQRRSGSLLPQLSPFSWPRDAPNNLARPQEPARYFACRAKKGDGCAKIDDHTGGQSVEHEHSRFGRPVLAPLGTSREEKQTNEEEMKFAAFRIIADLVVLRAIRPPVRLRLAAVC